MKLRCFSVCDAEQLLQVTSRQLEALFQYSVTGDAAYLLAPQRHLLVAQDEDGDTSVTKHTHQSKCVTVDCLIRVVVLSAASIWPFSTTSRRRSAACLGSSLFWLERRC